MVCPICGQNCGIHSRGDGVLIKRDQIKEGEHLLALDKRYFLNADKTRVVPEDSPDAAFLLGAKGHLISEADAEKLGLKGLKPADTSALMMRAENALPNRVNLDMPQFLPQDADAETVSLVDAERTPLEALGAKVEAQRAESQVEGSEGASDEKKAAREQPARGSGQADRRG